MRFDLFNANRICHQPEISPAGSFKTCRFLKLRGTVEFRVEKILLNEEVLKQLGIFHKHLARCPRSQDPSNSKKIYLCEEGLGESNHINFILHMNLQAYSACMCMYTWRRNLKNNEITIKYK